nr:hypothetical protein [Delftia acidovorans]
MTSKPTAKSKSASTDPKLVQVRVRSGDKQADPQIVTVPTGKSSGGYIVYGSPAKPKHTTVDRIFEAVLSLKAQ